LRSGGGWRWRAAWLVGVALAWAAGPAWAAVGERVLRIGYPVADAPYSLRNPAGQAEGASLRLVSAWLQRAGQPAAEWVPVTSSEGPAALKAGRIDLLLGVRGLPQPGLRLIGPYQRAPVVIVSAARYSFTGPAALGGRSVAVAGALQPQLVQLAPMALPRWHVVDNSAEALALVASGEVEAALTGLHATAERLRTRALSGLRITGVVPELSDARWLALREDQAALAAALSPALAPLLAEVLPGLEAEWAAHPGPPGIDWVQVREAVLVATLVVLALLAAALWYGRQLRREMDARASAQAQISQLLGFLAHEVRNALQSVSGAVALWQRRDQRHAAWQPGEVSTLASAVATAATAAVGRLDGLLDQHRLGAGTLGLQRRPEPLGEVVQELVCEAQAAARINGTAVVFEPRESDPGWWLVDAFRLQQVLRNLIGHALAQRPPGGVAVALALQHSPMGAGWGLAALAVHARGHDLPEEARRRLFDGPEPAEASVGEAGEPAPAAEHGLRLARDLAQAMGGTLVAESRPGDGLRLLLHLNLQAATPVAPEPLPRPLAQVLVVDDTVAYGLLLTHALADAGIRAQAVHSLEAAGQVLAAAGHDRPDLVLCDSHLGDGSLADWLGWCQGWRREGRVVAPVIGMSADFDTAEIAQLSALGALDLLTKDGDVADLVRRVQRIWAAQAA